MTTGASVVAIVTVMAALVLAVRGLRSHGLTFERKATMAAIWLVIIVVLAFVLGRVA